MEPENLIQDTNAGKIHGGFMFFIVSLPVFQKLFAVFKVASSYHVINMLGLLVDL